MVYSRLFNLSRRFQYRWLEFSRVSYAFIAFARVQVLTLLVSLIVAYTFAKHKMFSMLDEFPELTVFLLKTPSKTTDIHIFVCDTKTYI